MKTLIVVSLLLLSGCSTWHSMKNCRASIPMSEIRKGQIVENYDFDTSVYSCEEQ